MTIQATTKYKNLSPGVMKFTDFVDSSFCLIRDPAQTRKGEEILQFHYMVMPQHKNPCPGGNEIYSFGRLFLGHQYFILSLSGQCLGVEKKILKDIIHFDFMTYGYTLTQETMARGLRNLQFWQTFFCHHFYTLSLSKSCPRVKNCFLKTYINMTLLP